jgi:hypothetical protein
MIQIRSVKSCFIIEVEGKGREKRRRKAKDSPIPTVPVRLRRVKEFSKIDCMILLMADAR